MLLTTWASTAKKNIDGIEQHYKMPFNVNNVDYSVSANFLYAAMTSVFSGSFPDEVEEFPALIQNIAKFLVWGLKSGAVVDTPDLLLLYYPSPYLAFFFTSRTVQLLQQPQQVAEMELAGQVRDLLLPTAQTKITQYLLSAVQCTGELAFWDGASLGTNTPLILKHLNDHKFITALAVNTLINLWTTTQNQSINWLEQTPKEVPPLVTKGIYWLRHYALSNKNPNHNAFFSSSVKSFNSLPFPFPANLVKRVEGPIFQNKPPEKKTSQEGHSIFAMSGVTSRECYEQTLKEKNLLTVGDDAFKKCYELEFPYWSAPSVVHTLICCALTKAELLKI
jgi:hypothetical protein